MKKTSLGFNLFQPGDDFWITAEENSLNSNTKKINNAIEKIGEDTKQKVESCSKDFDQKLNNLKTEIGEDTKQKVESCEKAIEGMKSGTVELPFQLEVKEKFFPSFSVPENNSHQEDIVLTKDESDRFLFAFANLENGRTGHLVDLGLSKYTHDGIITLAMYVSGLTATDVSVRVYIVLKNRRA